MNALILDGFAADSPAATAMRTAVRAGLQQHGCAARGGSGIASWVYQLKYSGSHLISQYAAPSVTAAPEHCANSRQYRISGN